MPASVAGRAGSATHDISAVSETSCGDPSRWEVSDSAIGPIRVAARADSVLHLCAGTVDSIVISPDMEWVDTVRVLFVPVGPRDTVRVTIDRNEPRVVAIAVETTPFRTKDALGVGSPIRQWRGIPGVRVLYGDHYDEGVLVVPSHCGVAFRVSGEGGAPEARVADERTLAAWPETVRITALTVSGCSRS